MADGQSKPPRVCMQCGASPIQGYKFCSHACRDKARRIKLGIPTWEERYANAPGRQDRTCEHCGGTFQRRGRGKDALRFCSRDCGFAHQKANATGPKPQGACKVFFKGCAQCEQLFTARAFNARYCSNACSTKEYETRSLRQRIEAHPGRIECTCRECGKGFVAEYGNTRRIFCSAECSKRSVKRIWRKKERARLRLVYVEAVDPTKVFERDKWRCQECGVRTPRRLRGTYDDRAPELDHVVPLSQGGEHSYRNTQCLCRSCNGAKSNNVRGQLRLFG